MLDSSGPWSYCSNARIRCSSSSCTLHTSAASQRALFIFTFKAVKKIHPTVPAAVCAALFGKWELFTYNTFSILYVNHPLPPSLPIEPTPRGLQPHGTACYLVATGFLHLVQPQAPLPTGYSANYASCFTDPVHDTNWLTVSHCAHCSLSPG